jgi:hypothetical protein
VSRSVVQRFDARKVTLTFKSSPSQIPLVVGGTAMPTPGSGTSWVGYTMTISAPTPQMLGGNRYQFSKWSDGKAATHAITTPSKSKTYTATYRRG